MEFQPQTVVVDAITDFGVMGSPLEVKWLSVRLVDFFKAHGITALFTSLIASTAAEESGVGVSSVMDTWMHLQNVQSDLERNRTVFLIKSRGMAHSNQVREYLLTDNGVELRDIYNGPSGALLGSARIAQEALEKSDALKRHDEIDRKKRNLKLKQQLLESQILEMRAQSEAETAQLEVLIKEGEKEEKNLVENRRVMSRSRRADSPKGTK
jgi:circadian clock protein KaiC